MHETISYRNIWRVSYPLILSFFATTVINVTDTAFLGRISHVALGASGLGGVYFLIFLMAALGLGIGAQIIMARFHGEGKPQRIGVVFDHLLYLTAVLTIGLIVLHFALAPTLLGSLIKSPEILQSTLDYLSIRAFGFIPAFFMLAFRSFLTGISTTRPILYASILMAALNFVFNYAFVFGKFGFPRMEIEGAAYASVLAETLSLIYLIGWMAKKKLSTQFQFYRFPKPSFHEMRTILKLAAPIMIQHVISLGSWLTFFLIIEGMGERPLAISNVVRSGYSVLMVPLIGIGQATQTLVSSLIGQGGIHLMRKLVSRLILNSILSSVVLVLLNLINPKIALSVFTNDPSLILESILIIHVISISIVLFSVGMVLLSVISGTGNTLTTLLIEVSTLTIYLTFTYAMVKVYHQPLYIVWSSEIVYFTCIGLFSAGYLWSGKWKNTKVHD
ncbi:MAG: MATE family efflux transporter [Flavobacteriales bacterium]|nr:MATE family efflux transporter [Flavobacteriales bacterium]